MTQPPRAHRAHCDHALGKAISQRSTQMYTTRSAECSALSSTSLESVPVVQPRNPGSLRMRSLRHLRSAGTICPFTLHPVVYPINRQKGLLIHVRMEFRLLSIRLDKFSDVLPSAPCRSVSNGFCVVYI